MSEEVAAVPPTKKKKKSRLKLVVWLVAIVMLLGGGGAGAFWWMSRSSQPAGTATHAEPVHDDATSAAVSLPAFTVNLADKEASRFLRTTMALVVPDAHAAEEFTKSEHGSSNVKLMKARSAILELLSTQTAEQLSSTEGKDALKKAIAQRATKAFGTKVTDVLFSEFVVQY